MRRFARARQQQAEQGGGGRVRALVAGRQRVDHCAHARGLAHLRAHTLGPHEGWALAALMLRPGAIECSGEFWDVS